MQCKKIISLVLIVLFIIPFTISGCKVESPDSVLDEGINSFSTGKTDEDYSIVNSGTLLDELIDKFSGSYYQPTGNKMTDDDYDEAKKDADDPNPPDAPDTNIDTTHNTVSNYDELVDVFHKAYDNTSTQFEFTFVNGYSVDLQDVVQEIYWEIQREDPIDASGVDSWQWGFSGSDYIVQIRYFFDVDELIDIKAQTYNLVESAASSIDTNGLSDYEIVCAVNEYLCDTVVYPDTQPYEPVTHTAYGALKNGSAVCEGYACAAKLLLNKFGIMCDIQVGTCTNGEGHAWNLVKLENDWYQMDITWNDGSRNRTDYLLVTDAYMKKSRTWDESQYPATPSKPYRP